MYNVKRVIILICFLVLILGHNITLAQSITSENSDEITFEVLCPDRVPLGTEDIYLIVLKDSEGIGGAEVSIHKEDENIQALGKTEDTGHIRLPLPSPLAKTGKLEINVWFGETFSFSSTCNVYNKMSGETWFVDANFGSDSNSGKNRENAFKTITYALIQANGVAGNPDTIFVASGNYNPYMDYGHGEIFPLTMKSYVEVYGENMMTTIIDAQLVHRPIRFQGVESAVLSGFTVTGGKILSCGGGILFYNASGTISNNIIKNNNGSHGGGVCCVASSPLIHNNLIVSNTSAANGAGITLAQSSSPTISNCTIAVNDGPGIFVADLFTSDPIITDSIIWTNNDDIVNIESSEISFSDISDGDFNGTNNNFSQDPLFLCEYYLSNPGTGQPMDSPCIDAGSQLAAGVGLGNMTTRVDGLNDTGTVDVGFHYQYACSTECYVLIAP
ncbi:MAG: right-handed parallel beta-helix repeat-containing protein, partial [Deltaproteobacteria bacterium]|nr:right-handed parallel beta-helix repeat-containing protein [Deltaproteobacteria bacterium]